MKRSRAVAQQDSFRPLVAELNLMVFVFKIPQGLPHKLSRLTMIVVYSALNQEVLSFAEEI